MVMNTLLGKCRRLLGGLLVPAVLLLVLLTSPGAAFGGPRSGGSFGGRMFRSGGGFNVPRSSTGSSYGYGGGSRPSFFFLPSFGWGWGGMGYGGGFSSIMVLAVLGIAAFSLVRVARRFRGSGGGGWGLQSDDQYEEDSSVVPGRAYVYGFQAGLGRSARGIQDRLARFASEGDTSTESGLASLLQQTALELMREKDSIRYAGSDGGGPMSLANAETKMNGLALAERSRFQVERIRGSDGHVRRSEATAEEGKEALEYIVVTLVVATRTPMTTWKGITDRADLDLSLEQLGGVSSTGILGLEVIWTPADPNDSMTETDLMTTYPELRSL